MSEYRCIACGHIKEFENETSCNCTECGYRMFSAHLNRKDILCDEIKRFIKGIVISEINNDALVFSRTSTSEKGEETEKIYKEEDDARFPDFNAIVDYIYNAKKTEDFILRLNTSLEEIEKYFSNEFKAVYDTDFITLSELVDSYEVALKNASELFNEHSEILEFEFPEKVKLKFSQSPDLSMLNKLKEHISLLRELSDKTMKFIKQNNLFGVVDKISIVSKYDANKPFDYAVEMQKSMDEINALMSKQINVDLLSDGESELKVLLKPLFKGIEIVRKSPVFIEEHIFEYESQNYTKEEFFSSLIEQITSRYPDILAIADNYFSDKTDDELFNVYNKVLELDIFNIMGVDKSALNLKGVHEKQLDNLIGLESVKESIKKIKAYALVNKGSKELNLHMCFYGNPGTGKTEVARIIAGILYENKILPTKNVVEVDRGGLVGQYVGETAGKTMSVIQSAMGGVLFIDEAYALAPKDINVDYGHEAIATLIKAMEDYRGKFCVILAGYKNQMLDMISTNPGFKSRIQFELEFSNYSREELADITKLMIKKRNYTLTESVLTKILDITDLKRREANFANAREIRNILESIIMCQNLRVLNPKDKELGLVDVTKYIEDSKIVLPIDTSNKKMLTAEEELEELVGLATVKRMVKKIKAYAKKNKEASDFNLHMCFSGNPGTGKTEVARIISSILYDVGVLSEAKFVETDSHGLLGKVVGETAPKTQAKIQEAMGGVLFIDEAYGLNNSDDSVSKSYGDEAVEVLLKNMEDCRGKLCVILAGYKEEMDSLLKSNPGFESRIQFKLEFPDYTRDELQEIALRFINKKKYDIENDALELLLDTVEYFRLSTNFANARTVRNIVDQVIMNQNLRTEDDENESYEIIKSDVEDYLFDEKIDLSKNIDSQNRIGFI